MSDPTTSAVYTVWRVLTAGIKTLTFPPPPEGGDAAGPYVWFGDPSRLTAQEPDTPGGEGIPASPQEFVVVVSEVETPSIDWGPIGNYAREEKWRTKIRCKSAIPGRTALQTIDRLEQLTATVEAYIRSEMQAARKTDSFPDEFRPYELWSIAVDRVQPVAVGDEDGDISAADVMIRCEFRTNKPAIPVP